MTGPTFVDATEGGKRLRWIAGADRWPERKWAEMERELGVKAAAPITTTKTSRHDGPGREAAERPSGRSDWLGGRQRHWWN